ncbi:trypco2 family protein [Kitasatospora sp. NPDC048407]|uniref:trypco2 family protein n=1 Tax=Kitasatospora sp. NPDC048407 TaxID=3364051 RepID=UPI0037189693
MSRKAEELESDLFIKSLIRRVHAELIESRAEREESGQEPIFSVTGLTLEVNFVVERSREAKGGIEFKVITVGGLNIGGARGYKQQQVHKITLNLTALSDESGSLAGLDQAVSRFLPREVHDPE